MHVDIHPDSLWLCERGRMSTLDGRKFYIGTTINLSNLYPSLAENNLRLINSQSKHNINNNMKRANSAPNLFYQEGTWRNEKIILSWPTRLIHKYYHETVLAWILDEDVTSSRMESGREMKTLCALLQKKSRLLHIKQELLRKSHGHEYRTRSKN